MKITRPDKNTKITTFDSIQELVNHTKTTKVNQVFKDGRMTLMSEKTETQGNWYQTIDLDHAMSLLRNGWADKSKELEKKLNTKLKKEAAPVMRQRSVYDVVGGNASVPRYLQGVPTNMVRQVRQPVKEKVVTINYNISYSFMVTGDQIIQKAVDCLSYVKSLEDKGTRVNLKVYLVSREPHGGSKTFAYEVTVKKSSERLSISKLAFTLCHPSMLRRIMVSCIERDPEVTSEFVDGYGVPVRNLVDLKYMFPNTGYFAYSVFLIYMDPHSLLQPTGEN